MFLSDSQVHETLEPSGRGISMGPGLSQRRVRVRIPIPHEVEHADHGDQRDQAGWTVHSKGQIVNRVLFTNR